MNNLGSSFILLAVAILLLWLAVTDKLSNLLDAWDVATGKAKTDSNTSGTLTQAVKTATAATQPTLSMPSLPKLATMANVSA